MKGLIVDSTALKFPKPEKKKRSPRQDMTEKLDALVSKIVRARDEFCVTCGDHLNLTCSHWIPRRFIGTRFDLRNCNTQCLRCNLNHTEKFHKDGTPLGEEYGKYMRNYYSPQAMVELLRMKPKKVTVKEMESIYEERKALAKSMGLI